MPELPEIEAYRAALRARVEGEVIERVRNRSVSLLKTWDPPLEAAHGRRVLDVRRLGKRIVLGLEDELFLVVHLMVAGRLAWLAPGAAIPKKYGQAAFDFSGGTLLLTEAGTKRRASLHVVRGEDGLAALDPGGVEIADVSAPDFALRLRAARHTLKRALSDARILSGIGGAFADEILHRARLSPMQLTTNLSDEEMARLWSAARATMAEWEALRVAETGDGFPTKVTAFHPRMAVHGKYGEPCPVCGAPVQRIVYASRETNYCPGCQTDGRILRDRALSRLLRETFPKHLDEL